MKHILESHKLDTHRLRWKSAINLTHCQAILFPRWYRENCNLVWYYACLIDILQFYALNFNFNYTHNNQKLITSSHWSFSPTKHTKLYRVIYICRNIRWRLVNLLRYSGKYPGVFSQSLDSFSRYILETHIWRFLN